MFCCKVLEQCVFSKWHFLEKNLKTAEMVIFAPRLSEKLILEGQRTPKVRKSHIFPMSKAALIWGWFLGAFWEALGDPLAPFGTPGWPTLAIFRPRGRHFAAPGRHPRHHAVRALKKHRKIVQNWCQIDIRGLPFWFLWNLVFVQQYNGLSVF